MRYLLSFFSLLALCQAAHAEIMCGLTLEWLADTCPYVGIYTCEAVTPINGDSSHYVHLTVSLAGTLRGAPPDKFSFDYPGSDPDQKTPEFSPQKGDRFLIFLRDAGRNDIRDEQIISLTHPAKTGYPYVALTPDFSLLQDGKLIEKTVRDRIANRALAPVPWREYPNNRFRIEIPFGTAAFHAIWAGSSCFLIVPDDLVVISKAHQHP